MLHNIYYKYISERNIKNNQTNNKQPKISLTLHLGDARGKVRQFKAKYNHIFLDAFTPAKLPTLWTVEFFEELYKLLDENGNLLTYSNSAAVRNGLIEAGFFVGKTEYGTIACKNSNLIKFPLDKKARGLLQTKAGIPFYDPRLVSTKEEILKLREELLKNSLKQSSSQFLKNYQNNSEEL